MLWRKRCLQGTVSKEQRGVYIPRMIKPGPCFFPTRTTCAGWSTADNHRASSPNCRLFPLLEKRIWCVCCWRHLAQMESNFEPMRGPPPLRNVVRAGNCHGFIALVRCRTENIDRMVFCKSACGEQVKRCPLSVCSSSSSLVMSVRGGGSYRKSQRTSSDGRLPTTTSNCPSSSSFFVSLCFN